MLHAIDPVLIVGAGPVGVTMANLLGRYGIPVTVIDRSPRILDYPRAVGLDDEAMRTFQAAGLAESMLRDMIQNVPLRLYTGRKECFAEILPSTQEFGWCRRNLFSQPLGERALREGLAQYPHVQLRVGVELEGLHQDRDAVVAHLRCVDGSTQTVRASYLLAADGGRSTVRELLGVPFEGKTHARKWVVIECDEDPLDAPYTALHCEPGRPYVCLRLPYGLRRWEFMLFPGEDGEQMLQPAKVRELLGRHVADPAALNVIRARVYTHNSRVARDFVQGRICLAGDAAHITPPWIGQGLNAGLRDAFNLSWKIAWILSGRLRPEALDSYQHERHDHARAMIELADLFGAMLSQTHRGMAWLRDRFFMAVRDIPRVRDYVLQMKFKPMPRYTQGVVRYGGNARHDAPVGRMFIQPRVARGDGSICKLDDVIGDGFALLARQRDPLEPADTVLAAMLERLACRRIVSVHPKGVESMHRDRLFAPAVTVVEDHENLLHLWFQRQGVDWVLLRPDRYVAAAGHYEDMAAAVRGFCTTFMPPTA